MGFILIHYDMDEEYNLVDNLWEESALFKNSLDAIAIQFIADYAKHKKDMVCYIKKGDSIGLKTYLKQDFPNTNGIPCWYLKYALAILAETVAEAAVSGGMDTEEAFFLSWRYILQGERLYDNVKIILLMQRMLLHFATVVERLNNRCNYSKFIMNTIHYINHNMDKPVTLKILARHMKTSQSQLRMKFKREVGCTIQEYVTARKIEEARYLLIFSTDTIVEISNKLGFSSQSHFQNTFKKYINMTPKKYRETS